MNKTNSHEKLNHVRAKQYRHYGT